MLPEQAGLLRDVLERLHEDGPRLLYADWCEDHGEPERAEFIRLDIELYRGFGEEESDGGPLNERDERFALWHSLAVRLDLLRSSDNQDVWWPEYIRCQGTYPAHTRRGWPFRISLKATDFLTWAEDLFRVQPILDVRLADLEPQTSPLLENHQHCYWYRWSVYNGGRQCDVPDDIFDHLLAGPTAVLSLHNSPEEAHAAMSTACVAYGRSLAGLPPLLEPVHAST